jgi:hypothetical protein
MGEELIFGKMVADTKVIILMIRNMAMVDIFGPMGSNLLANGSRVNVRVKEN